jgi:integrase
MFHKVLADAGLPHMHFHDLRHSAATILLAMGVNIKVVQEILGHSQVSMTLGIYSHVLPGMQEEAMGRMNDLFRKRSDNKDEAAK